jgi:hypothetical protein
MALSAQLFWLFIPAIPIASVAWTITHEEVFSEARHWCEKKAKNVARFCNGSFSTSLLVNTALAIGSRPFFSS